MGTKVEVSRAKHSNAKHSNANTDNLELLISLMFVSLQCGKEPEYRERTHTDAKVKGCDP